MVQTWPQHGPINQTPKRHVPYTKLPQSRKFDSIQSRGNRDILSSSYMSTGVYTVKRTCFKCLCFRQPTSGGVTSRTRSVCLSVCLYVCLQTYSLNSKYLCSLLIELNQTFQTEVTWSKGHVSWVSSLQDHARAMFGQCSGHVLLSSTSRIDRALKF